MTNVSVGTVVNGTPKDLALLTPDVDPRIMDWSLVVPRIGKASEGAALLNFAKPLAFLGKISVYGSPVIDVVEGGIASRQGNYVGVTSAGIGFALDAIPFAAAGVAVGWATLIPGAAYTVASTLMETSTGQSFAEWIAQGYYSTFHGN